MRHTRVTVRPALEMDTASVFADHSIRQPDAPAIMAPGKVSLTFAGLEDLRRDAGRVLAGKEIGRGDPVAVMLPRGPDMAAACAVLPAVATVMSMAPNLTADEYETLFRRSGAKALIAPHGDGYAAFAAARRAGMVRFATETAPDAPAGRFELTEAADHRTAGQSVQRNLGENIAFIMTTSGTTARPKLVPIRHDAIIGYADAMKDWLRLGPGEVNLHLSPMHFSHGIKSTLMVPLLAGGTVICPADFEIGEFFPLLEECRPTWLGAGFTMYREILRMGRDHRDIARDARLRFLRSSFGKLTDDEFARLEALFESPVIVPLSSTETCLMTCNPLPPGERKPGTVGMPVVNEVRIAGDDGRTMGTGERGEVLVRGPLVFDGYLDDPEANRSAFLDGWYRTGDVGFFDQDGYLTLVGRIKEMINRGGEKISPVEVDGVLTSHPDVADAACYAVPHPTLGEIVGAAVMPKPNTHPASEDILSHCAARLSPAKMPRDIRFVDRIPRGESGKILRAELASQMEAARTAPVEDAGRTPRKPADPGTPTMLMLSALWLDCLNRDAIGPDDDFFLMGGDSLMATQLALAVNEGFQVQMPLEAVFREAKTIRTMAAMIDALRSAGPPEKVVRMDLPMSAVDTRIPAGARACADAANDDNGATEKEFGTANSIFRLNRRTGYRSLMPHARLGAVVTNEHGFRSPAIPQDKPAGTIRVAFLGNSVTFGSWHHRDEDTWPAQTMAALRGAVGGTWDHLNAAHPGMTTDHMAHKYRETISAFRPDIVVITPGDRSDTAALARRKLGYTGLPYRLSAFGQSSPLAERIEKNLVVLWRQLGRGRSRVKLRLEADELRQLSDSFERRLLTLAAEVRNSGAVPVFVIPEGRLRRRQRKWRQASLMGSKLFYHPYMTAETVLEVIEEYNRAIRAVAAETGSILIDLEGLLPATRRFYEDNSHFTAVGHQAIGAHLGRILGRDPRIRALRGA